GPIRVHRRAAQGHGDHGARSGRGGRGGRSGGAGPAIGARTTARHGSRSFPGSEAAAANRTELSLERVHSVLMGADGFASPPPGARADWTIDQDWAGYTEAEHRVWIILYERQAALLP